MKKILTSLFLLFIFSAVYAQSSEVITDILNTKKVTFGQVCYLSAVQQNIVSDSASYGEAIEALYKKGQLPRIVYEDTVIPMADLAFLYAKMWNVKGGVFYNMFHGAPRYAFKQLKSDGVIPANADPTRLISGAEALNIYTACSIEYGKMKLYVE